MFSAKHSARALYRAAAAALRPTAPILAHIVVIRRCNLTCGYCNEYDDVSPPVPTEELFRRVDHLANLGTVFVTITGGEPLLHPELHRVVDRITSHGMICTLISNGYAMTERWINRLNAAGLSLVQISIDNVEPNDVSQKSWSKVKKRLVLLREKAKFRVNINAVLGSCPPEQTRQVTAEVRELGFYMTVGLMHDGRGQLDAGLVGDGLSDLYHELRGESRKSLIHHAGEGWEEQMIRDGAAPFRCRAGARYLYIDEFGKVSYCSQRRGDPGIPLLEYGKPELEAAFYTAKGCESSCTIACVRRASSLDGWRAQAPVPAEPDIVRLPVV